MGDKETLMTPEDVAIELVEDIEEVFPRILYALDSETANPNEYVNPKDVEGHLAYQIQDAKIATYNMHMDMQGFHFPLDNASDFSDDEKFQELLNWLDKHYPSNS